MFLSKIKGIIDAQEQNENAFMVSLGSEDGCSMHGATDCSQLSLGWYVPNQA